MNERPEDVTVLNVFTDANGQYGNPLGVLLGTSGLPNDSCQRIATELGFSETVFIDDPASATLRIFTPAVELPFAGHPLVGTAWLLKRLGFDPPFLAPPAGAVPFETDGAHCSITAEVEWCPAWTFREVTSVAELEGEHPGEAEGAEVVWAWMDREEGIVRVRVFASAVGVCEDEATGSAALPLAMRLGRQITILQGRGSVLSAGPVSSTAAKVGGLVSIGASIPLPSV